MLFYAKNTFKIPCYEIVLLDTVSKVKNELTVSVFNDNMTEKDFKNLKS